MVASNGRTSVSASRTLLRASAFADVLEAASCTEAVNVFLCVGAQMRLSSIFVSPTATRSISPRLARSMRLRSDLHHERATARSTSPCAP